MKFIQYADCDFFNIDAIAEVSFSGAFKQQRAYNPDIDALPTADIPTRPTATVTLFNGSRRVLTGDLVDLLRGEVEGKCATGVQQK